MWIPLNCLSHGSHLFSQTKPEDIAKFATQHDLPTIGLADLGNLSQCGYYHEEMRKVGKKPLLGTQLGICSDYACVHIDNPTSKRLLLYARNKEGWKSLLRIVFESNQPQNILNEPRLSINELEPLLNDNLLAIIHSDLSEEEGGIVIKKVNHTYCGINPIEGLVENRWGISEVPIFPNYYLDSEGAMINRLLLCKHFKVKLDNATKDIHPSFEDDRYWLNTKFPVDDKRASNTLEIYDLIEDFDITRPEALPHFSCPKGQDESAFLTTKCKRALQRMGLDRQPYIDRLEYELSVINGAGMGGYFLVLSDITEFCRKARILYGNGRGSAAGCLISYLLEITKVDPLKHDLMFERFYNPSRKEYPDIDLDIQPSKRAKLEEYIRKKYGKDRFMQYATFGTLKGKAALKLALTTSKKGILPDEQNEITKLLPEEAKIDAELKEQNKVWGNRSSILYSLLNEPHVLEKWCTFDSESHSFNGPYAEEFEFGVKLNTIIQARGRHASAFVLSSQPMHELVPVVWDVGSASFIIGVDMDAGQAMGLVKLDLLGIKLLDEFEYMKGVLDGNQVV